MMNVRQTNITASLLNAHDHVETNNENCECAGCRTDRTALGCKHPNWCATRAKKLLDLLPEKWDPREIPYEDDEVIEGEKDWTTFEPGTITAKNLGETIRIFDNRDKEDKSEKIPRFARIDRLRLTRQIPQRAATDGSCINNGFDNARAGAGVYFRENDPKNKSVRLPKDLEQTNQTGELIAIKLAVESADPDEELWIETDSKYAIGCITQNRGKNEDEGYIETNHASIIKDLLVGLRRRTARTLIKWVKGHQGYGPNEKADKLAGEGAMKPMPDAISDWTLGTLSLEGAKIAKMTQALAYKKIRQSKETSRKNRERTKGMIELAKAQTKEIFGINPTEGAIWKAIRSKENAMQTRQFLWMTAHDAFMVGDKWLRKSSTAELRERAECKHCEGEQESMTHIITECKSPGQKEIWEAAKTTWENKSEHPWIKPSTGAVIGAGLAAIRDKETQKLKAGKNRLWKILISESAHLIWRLRCERVIGNDNRPFKPEEVRARWENTINDRIRLDRLLMNKKRYANKALSERAVENTWKRTLKNEGDLPTDWVRQAGVLVGIEMDQARRKGKRG
ncbi:hypothetical protein PQX77_021325 [Marasmius sp. AFHP31]|nr:hypothetical protein PQX77_021325 [Marasmius sp. AFHP31]